MEIRNALFDMAPLKAPSSDGFHALFFQKQWDTVGPTVCEWVKNVFNDGNIDDELNNTLIALILKVHNPEGLSQFRSISLYTVLYKLVMKVIANQFKHVFPKIIVQEQAGFIARRNITHNIVITQEIIHSMKSCNNKKWMAVKIDLEKVYDRVDGSSSIHLSR